ncbi:hypothetical protein Mgra_00005831 [Meloidogyne graminicola]|uniref:Uncharacterized protein n=1 Tax=Meloidogyne graminicola TaxID=189291 RepID=A0A8S9ZMU2_9BILA|nr:hypothetical protein Mgra_00005831 [Meloidogyne graminicola]
MFKDRVQYVQEALFNMFEELCSTIQLERWSPVQYVRGALFNVKELMHRMVVSNGCATSALLRHGRRVVYVMFNCSGFLVRNFSI